MWVWKKYQGHQGGVCIDINVYTHIFQLPIYFEPVCSYLIYWHLGAWFQIDGELEDQNILRKLEKQCTYGVLGGF